MLETPSESCMRVWGSWIQKGVWTCWIWYECRGSWMRMNESNSKLNINQTRVKKENTKKEGFSVLLITLKALGLYTVLLATLMNYITTYLTNNTKWAKHNTHHFMLSSYSFLLSSKLSHADLHVFSLLSWADVVLVCTLV